MPLLETLPLTPHTAQWAVWSTTARLVVTEPGVLAAARDLVEARLAAVDAACSRFRDDSELQRANIAGGPTPVSDLLADLVHAALTAARRTDGDVDPTVGGWLRDLGYDRDFTELAEAAETAELTETAGLTETTGFTETTGPTPAGARAGTLVVHPHPDWRAVGLAHGRLTVPAGVSLDLGATAKAYTADLCARDVAEGLGVGVLVALGGDIATAGAPPEGGWRVLVRDRPGDPACTVTLPPGAAVATSSTVSRRWWHRGHTLHHIIDPRTGRPVRPVWRTATVAAASCIEANTASTAALVRGEAAVDWLRRTGLPARLVSADLAVTTIGGWPGKGELAP